MPKRKSKRSEKVVPMSAEAIEAPARIRATHRQDRTLSVVAGAAKGFRSVDWPIQIAHEAGRLQSEERWLAIRQYNEWVETGRGASRDSTVLDIVKGGGGFPITEAMADATRKVISTKGLLPQAERIIVTRLCEGWSLPGAVKAACGDDFKFAVAARVRTALDALIHAMKAARRSGYKFDMRAE